jgi:hypothetical protein
MHKGSGGANGGIAYNGIRLETERKKPQVPNLKDLKELSEKSQSQRLIPFV